MYVDCLYRKRSGKKAYYIPMAAPDVCGLWGYMEAFREMIEQVSIPVCTHINVDQICLDVMYHCLMSSLLTPNNMTLLIAYFVSLQHYRVTCSM